MVIDRRIRVFLAIQGPGRNHWFFALLIANEAIFDT
jgi:hypothetical protein